MRVSISRVLRVTALLLCSVAALPVPADDSHAAEYLYVGNNRAGTVSVIEVPGFRVVEEFDVIPDHPDRPDSSGTWVDDVVAPAASGVLYVSRADRGLHRGRADSEQVVYASCPQGTERNRF